jgi:hypothetical protein
MKQAEGAFDAAEDRFGAAERALDVAREERAQARRERYTARQAYERASTTADRLARRVRELAEHLGRAAELASRIVRVFQFTRWTCGGLTGGATRSGARTGTSGHPAGCSCRGSGAIAQALRRCTRTGPSGTLDGCLPGAGVPVGVVRPAARARSGDGQFVKLCISAAFRSVGVMMGPSEGVINDEVLLLHDGGGDHRLLDCVCQRQRRGGRYAAGRWRSC